MGEEFLAWFNDLPVCRLLGLRCLEVYDGGARIEVVAREEHRNPNGHISGAVISGAVDIAAGIAVTGATDGLDSATGDLNLHFLAPARQSPLRLEVEVLRRGRRTCVPQVRVYEAGGRLCTIATGTWLLRETAVPFPVPSAAPARAEQGIS